MYLLYCIVLCFSGIIYGRIFKAVSKFLIWKLDIYRYVIL